MSEGLLTNQRHALPSLPEFRVHSGVQLSVLFLVGASVRAAKTFVTIIPQMPLAMYEEALRTDLSPPSDYALNVLDDILTAAGQPDCEPSHTY